MTQLITKDETTTALASWGDESWESDGTEEYEPLPGNIKLVSSFSRMDGADKHVGEFWHSDREGPDAFSAELDIIPLIVRTTRTFFEAASEEPLCRSNDGTNYNLSEATLWDKDEVQVRPGGPFVAVPDRRPLNCHSCPFSQWDEASNTPPICGEARVLAVVRQDDNTAATWRVSGTGLKRIDAFIRGQVKNKRRPLFSWRVNVTTQRVVKGQKVFYDLKFNLMSLTREEAMVYNALVKSQRERFGAEDDYDEADQEVTASNGGAPSFDEPFPADEHNFTDFWANYSNDIGLPKSDMLAAIAPKKLTDFSESELYDVLVRFGAELAGRDPNTLDDGERRLLVERVRGGLMQEKLL